MRKWNDARFLVLTALFFFAPVLLLAQPGPSVTYPETFRFKAGDRPEWALPDFDDSTWATAKYGTLPDALRKTTGWARFVIYVEPDSLNKPLGLCLHLEGAGEIYLDGRLILSLGKVGLSKEGEVPVIENHLNAYVISFKTHSFASDSKESYKKGSRHVLAIRYSSFFLNRPRWSGYRLGLRFSIGDIQKMNRAIKKAVRKFTTNQVLRGSVFMVLAFLHMLLFLFYPKEKVNLYFSLFAAVSATAVFFIYQQVGAIKPAQVIAAAHILYISLILISLFGLRFAYSLLYPRPPKFFRFLLIPVGAVLFIWSLSRPFYADSYVILFTLVSPIEIPRAVLSRSRAVGKERGLLEGSWIIGLGSIPLILAGLYKILRLIDLIPPFLPGDTSKPFSAMMVLMISVSVFLARRFAKTSKDLEAKLAEVKELSEKTLAEERIRLQLEAENTRKTRELEEARKLQLSMLPEIIPRLPHLEIAVYMHTATEVGGDYYDFFLEENGTENTTLTVAFGDATGHGLQAGTMVAATKSLFNAYASEKEPVRFLQKTSHALKKMGFRKMFMAMTIAKFTGNHMRLAAAGMPFALIRHAASNSVEEVVLKGMPLGGVKDFPYKEAQYTLEKGDTVLFMSDGLPEAFNPQNQMLGPDRVKNAFREIANQGPEQIISHLVETGKTWADGIEFHDDATLMAIKII